MQRRSTQVQRASRNIPANPHNYGHYAGFHGEDQPYLSDDLIEDDSYYETRPPTSTRRYQTTEGNQVIQQGNRRIVIHNEPPPKRQMHWSFILGLGMILALFLWIGASQALAWWNNHQLDSIYGMPRTYQTDFLVYPSDTLDHPSHYIFLNLNGTIMIVEIPHGDPTHARIYKGLSVFSGDAAYTPATGEFKQVNGKVEMIVHVGDQQFLYVNDGTQFKPQQ
jgi:hypothetical protein